MSGGRKAEALTQTRRFVAPHRVDVWDAFDTQLVMGRREGYRMWDLDGHELIDLHLNGGTFNLGHRNPEVVAALVDALDRLDIGNHHFASAERGALGERLAALTPGDLRYSVFASGGSEAVDVAIKTARRATGRRRIVALDAGYHGRTGLSGAAGAPGTARYFHIDQPAEFTTVPFGDLDALEREVERGDVAAFIVETVPATYGFPVPADGYLPGARQLCTDHGALYVADEVQTGLGRTGPLWAVERFGVAPDILVTGKGLSGGVYPIAATVIGERAAGWLNENGWGHVSTFGGSELGCVVARTVLDITTRPSVRARVDALTTRFGDGLRRLRAEQPYLTEIRQTGLVIGLRLDHPDGGIFLQQELYRVGVWAIASGFDQSVLQFKPGLLVDDALADDVLARLGEALRIAKDVDRPVPRRHPRPAAA